MPNSTLVNFAGGETSPRSRGRFDLPWFSASCRKMLNYIAEVPGPARYRSGFRFAGLTRGGAVARIVPFQLNDSQAYMLEFTDEMLRIWKNGATLKSATTTITAVTKAATAVVSFASVTDFASGDYVVFSDVEGMYELNGREVRLGIKVGSTFEILNPVTGAGIDSRNFGTYTSGGTVSLIYEIESPYREDDLDDIQWAQSNDTMYLTHPLYAPYKLTTPGTDSFTLGTYSRTNDPFSAEADNLSNFTTIVDSDDRILIKWTTGTPVEGVIYSFSTFVGSTGLNGKRYRVEIDHSPSSDNQALLKNLDGSYVAFSEAGGAYVSGGLAEPDPENPLGVCFYESRLWFIGSNQRPNTLFGSAAPSNTGDTRYDVFTGGTDPDDAVFFTLAPASGQVDYAAWGRGTAKYLFVGTFGGPFRVSGAGLDEPITPSSINVRQLDLAGCEAVMPAGGSRLFFISRGGTALRTARYNGDIDDFETYDMTINAEHIPASRLRRVALQSGRPEILWVVREDGILAGMTVQGAENVAGWHRHRIGGQDGKVLDIQPLPRSDKDDQLWIVAERSVNGALQRSVEFMADDVAFPDLEDFYNGGDTVFADADEDDPGIRADGRADDVQAWRNAVYRRQEEYIHLDSAGTYNGTDRGAAADATLTAAALSGDEVTFTTDEDVFKASDVGNELWKKPDRETGDGTGRAEIIEVVSATEVTCKITKAFDTLSMEPGDWYITADTIYVPHLENEVVAVVTDGAVYTDGRGNASAFPLVRVENGRISLEVNAGVVHVGLLYKGFIETQNLEAGGRNGPVQGKPRNIVQLFLRMLYSLGTSYGTDLYKLERIAHRSGNDVLDRPSPVFSGIKKLKVTDRWQAQDEKHVFIAQQLPLPSIVQFIDIHFEVGGDD